MNIILKLKPLKFTASTKTALITKITMALDCNHRYFKGNGGWISGYGDSNKKVMYFVNFVKFRNKQQVKKNGRRVQVRDAHWDAFVYTIPDNMILTGQQNTRTFDLKFKNL